MYWGDPEITPSGQGVHRRRADGQPTAAFEAAAEVRAVVEGQLMAKRLHAESLGFQIGEALSGCPVWSVCRGCCRKGILQPNSIS